MEGNTLREAMVNSYTIAFASSALNTCETQKLRMMESDPMKVQLKEDAIPVLKNKPFTAPLHLMNAVKADIDNDVRLGIIEAVPNTDKSPWCALG